MGMFCSACLVPFYFKHLFRDSKNVVTKINEEVKQQLCAISVKYPRESLHYVPQYHGDNHAMHYEMGLSIAHFHVNDFLKDGSKHDK